MDRQVHILILEDNASDAELMQRELRRAGFDFTAQWVQDEATFVRALDESAPDLILTDYSLPGFDALAALALARERFPEVPVIIVSGAIGEETAIETLKAGATDYVLKQRLNRLGPVVLRALREAQELVEKKRAEEAIRQAKEEWERTFNTVPDLIAILDCQHRVVRMNRAMADRLGVTPDEAVGISCHEAVHGALMPPPFCPHALTCRDGKEHVAEVHEPRLGGDFIVSTTPLLDGQGQPIGAIHVARDITDRKRAEKALEDQVRLLQRALLPSKPPTIEGYSVAYAYIPGYAGVEIGGDFYDVFRTENGKIGLLIGDVTGKGIEAAALAAATRSTVRAFAYETSSPGEALNHTNSVLTGNQITTAQFVTVFVAVLDPATGDVRYASGGHPPLVLHHASGEVQFLSFGNMPLGVMDSTEYREGEALLEPGAKIILYTDGITEARHRGVLFGSEGIAHVLQEYGHLSASEIVNHTLSAASEWADGQLTDDIAILVVERNPC